MNKAEKIKNRFKEIINSNNYLSLATINGEEPWVCTLYYCIDKHFNIYFISQIDTLHVENILINPKVAFTIFDSHQREGEGNGIQGSGRVEILKDEKIDEGLKTYQTSFIDLNRETLTEPFKYRLCKLIPEKFYILDPDSDEDKRVLVKLNR
ncbi:MAG TPA: pyridoxamine 5'-phosphate oxidase family protein [Candidatus Dojkabacteria bacterium]|nr:pyridoxamine 5'-phosphate oxidase family protein [Candidatus Dojkabacteria bacterium]HRO65444.1 pyridoxamine 5'-phosphate oxidase family protein [Candidatus Dojkabacteria bacterium]HRP51387.1 pyridoxamine 5'-phosphate oxidase family protein [Candidatus Dojkabacteria bacterium]